MKPCICCKEVKALGEFYPHPMMADGHLNKCKECCKTYQRIRSVATRTQRAEYERKRAQDPKRKIKMLMYQRRRRAQSPNKSKARSAVFRALASGRLERQPCEVCGNPKTQAHHDDYSKPLDVRWLCFKHHCEVHGRTTIPEVPYSEKWAMNE